MTSKHFIGIHGYMLVYSVSSKQSFEMIRTVRDKLLNHLVSPFFPLLGAPTLTLLVLMVVYYAGC